MTKGRRVCRLADKQFRNVDLRQYKDLMMNTINEVVPGKNPEISKDGFSTDELTHSEAVRLGQALSRLDALKPYGKIVSQFRLFEGKTVIPTQATKPDDNKTKGKPRGGRRKS